MLRLVINTANIIRVLFEAGPELGNTAVRISTCGCNQQIYLRRIVVLHGGYYISFLYHLVW